MSPAGPVRAGPSCPGGLAARSSGITSVTRLTRPIPVTVPVIVPIPVAVPVPAPVAVAVPADVRAPRFRSGRPSRPQLRGRGILVTASAAPSGVVTMIRHSVPGSSAAYWTIRRAWVAVTGPIRPRYPGPAEIPARTCHGRDTSSSPERPPPVREPAVVALPASEPGVVALVA